MITHEYASYCATRSAATPLTATSLTGFTSSVALSLDIAAARFPPPNAKGRVWLLVSQARSPAPNINQEHHGREPMVRY
jgi:hypothetical protein